MVWIYGGGHLTTLSWIETAAGTPVELLAVMVKKYVPTVEIIPDKEPEEGFKLPVQKGPLGLVEAVAEVALLIVHPTVILPFWLAVAILPGVKVPLEVVIVKLVIMGGLLETVTVADWEVLPPVPVHSRV